MGRKFQKYFSFLKPRYHHCNIIIIIFFSLISNRVLTFDMQNLRIGVRNCFSINTRERVANVNNLMRNLERTPNKNAKNSKSYFRSAVNVAHMSKNLGNSLEHEEGKSKRKVKQTPKTFVSSSQQGKIEECEKNTDYEIPIEVQGEEAMSDSLQHLLSEGHVSQFWVDKLAAIERPLARRLLPQLVPSNPLAFDASPSLLQKGKLFEFFVNQKKAHPEKVCLVRVGDFYETYGVDSVMLVAYAGLNPMGGKPKAGCPKQNIQQTLDCLTDAGLTVAVFEEINEADIAKGPSTRRMKKRVLGGIVSPGAATYAYDLSLSPQDIPFKENRPYVGILKAAQGYTLCEICVDEKKISVSEHLTLEAMRTMLEAKSPVEPILTCNLEPDPHYLPQHRVILPKSEDFISAAQTYVCAHLNIPEEAFRIVKNERNGRPMPVYSGTLSQIGLLPNPHVPPLVSMLLPSKAPAHATRFLERWLRDPPPYHLAEEMQKLCSAMLSFKHRLPRFRPVPTGKLVTLLESHQANALLFQDIQESLQGMLEMLEDHNKGGPYTTLVEPLIPLLSFESNMPADPQVLEKKGNAILQKIRSKIAGPETQDPCCSDPNVFIPDSFFQKNEEIFRGTISGQVIAPIYDKVKAAASALISAVKEDYLEPKEITFDQVNNLIVLRKCPSNSDPEMYFHPTDRNGRKLAKRWITQSVQEALTNYVFETQTAEAMVKKELQALSKSLCKDLLTLIQSGHWAVLVSTVYEHTRMAVRKGWSLPTLRDIDNKEEMALNVKDLIPYWMEFPDKKGRAVPNSFVLERQFLLTAPNMSGKSTLMRATLAAALLANAGLFVPCKSSTFPRYDNYFLRTSSFDIPSEGKSAFALEMQDIGVMLRDSGSQSLVMVDEVGKGTSSRDGASVAGALLEEMARNNIRGIFSTHLHELFDLPLSTNGVLAKRMSVEEGPNKEPIWTYRLKDGKCRNSLALLTAKQYDIPLHVITRASILAKAFDEKFRNHLEQHAQEPKQMNLNSEKNNATSGKPKVTEISHENENISFYTSGWTSLARAEEILSEVSGTSRSDMIVLPPGYDSPPSLEGKACVYLLKDSDKNQYYVGETECITRRMKEHQQKLSAHGIKEWSTVIVPLLSGQKSQATSIEKHALVKLKENGFVLLNIKL